MESRGGPALARNRTLVSRVTGVNSTSEPPMRLSADTHYAIMYSSPSLLLQSFAIFSQIYLLEMLAFVKMHPANEQDISPHISSSLLTEHIFNIQQNDC